jgi:hypothetical protein
MSTPLRRRWFQFGWRVWLEITVVLAVIVAILELSSHYIEKGNRVQETRSQLKLELKNAITRHYHKLTTEIPDVYGYSLYTVDDVPSVGPVANRESALTVDPSDDMYNYHRYLAVEWSEWNDFGLFDAFNKIVSGLHADESIAFELKREMILRVCLEVLCELEAEGVFGPRTDSRFLVICVADSDEKIMMESAKKLNTTVAFEAYATQF